MRTSLEKLINSARGLCACLYEDKFGYTMLTPTSRAAVQRLRSAIDDLDEEGHIDE